MQHDVILHSCVYVSEEIKLRRLVGRFVRRVAEKVTDKTPRNFYRPRQWSR